MKSDYFLMRSIYTEGVYYIPSVDKLTTQIGLHQTKYDGDRRRKAI